MADRTPAEDFAARLRELKERSGLSFGTLAARLHLGTSTLHRYCSGAVVPADYAPVERLARLCGADRDELLELHRLWLRADASRPAAGPGGGRAPGQGPARATEPGQRPGREAAARQERDARAPAAPGTGPAAAPVASDRAAEPGPGDRSARRPEADSGAGRGAVRVSRYGARRWWPVAGAVVASLVLGVAVVNLMTSDGTAGPAASAAEEEPPLAWTADSQVWAEGCGHRYLVDRAPGDVPAPPVAQDAAPWAQRLGAVHEGSTIVEATVRLTRPTVEPVVVEAVHVRVTERRTPLDWPVFDMSPGCGGALTPAAFTVDLDADRPVARPREGFDGDTGTDLQAPALPFAVTADEPLALRVEADAAACDCAWYIELDWSAGDERGTVRVDDGGEPFRTSGGGAGAAAPHSFAMDTESWRRG
ncbi:helix-turn-helix domain-containing protein [Streptomyces sp. URMC 129]|uniref:helix-turn-helix domain-containing protein n=1 Tax=Streptomyces sp. URMC 129 TaxID=3423407 RepID=UPI003F1B0457